MENQFENKRVIKTTRFLTVFWTLLLAAPVLHAQYTAADYLNWTIQHLDNGDCDKARETYALYTDLVPQGNAEVKRRIEECEGCPSVNDYEKHTYSTVKIGSQCWMAENMRTQYDRKGTKLEYVFPPNGDEKNVARYGYLYDWWTAKTICPKGWHLPSDKEWQKLIDGCSNIADLAGGERGTWIESSGKTGYRPGYPGDYNYSKRNVTGFTALPAGSLSWGDDGNPWYSFREAARFWCSTVDEDEDDVACRVWFPHELASKYWSPSIFIARKHDCMSVRCVRD